MEVLLSGTLTPQQIEILLLGFNHEQQHQELLCTDIKYILGHNPLFPSYSALPSPSLAITGQEEETDEIISTQNSKEGFVSINEGIYEIGYEGKGFCFDNEVYLQNFSICEALISNEEYLEFIDSGGYRNFKHWHADGWEWVKTKSINAPLYWHFMNGEWFNYTIKGLKPLLMAEPLCHVSYYEASAFASWKGMRLPTEFEWETAASQFEWGKRWEWTESAYLPYPGFTKAPGAIGEYNGKFMINQMVLRGASEATSSGHSRRSYRNFFQPELRWQFTGIRLVK
jgi:ergothioneine biosynthesis protein EgtB